jgi:hypothetical protein
MDYKLPINKEELRNELMKMVLVGLQTPKILTPEELNQLWERSV